MHRRFFAYLSLCFVAYSIFSYMNIKPLYFILLFLLLLPLVSFIMLVLARHYVRWAIRTEHEDNFRLEEGRAVLSLTNLSFFFFPHITIYIDEPSEDKGFIINSYTSEEIKDKSEWENDKGFIQFKDFPEDLNSKQLLTLSDSEYARALENKWLKSLAIPIKKFFIFPKFRKMRKTRQHVVYLAAYARYDWHFRYTPTHVGEYTISANKLFARDYFGFFSLPLKQNKNAKLVSQTNLTIMPNSRYYRARFIHKLPEPQPSDFARANNRISNEVNALANIREWRQGDRMKDIHFNISSKHQSFYVKEYEDPRRGGILFLVDPYLPNKELNPNDYYDELSETSSSIIEEINKGDGPLVLRFADKVCEGPGGQKSLNKFLKFLAKQQPLDAELRRLADKQAGIKRSELSSALNDNKSLKNKSSKNINFRVKDYILNFFNKFSKLKFINTYKLASRAGQTNVHTTKVLPSLSHMLRQEFKSEKYRGIIVISPSFTPLLAETLISAAKQKSTRIVFVHLENTAEAQSSLKNAQNKGYVNDFDNSIHQAKNKDIASEDKNEQNSKVETMDKKQREYFFRRLETMKVIIFHVAIDSLGNEKKTASHLKVVSRTELRKNLSRSKNKHYRPNSNKLKNKSTKVRGRFISKASAKTQSRVNSKSSRKRITTKK